MKKINLKKPTRNQVIRICNLLSVPLQFLGCCVLYLVIEALSRHSLREAWQYMTGSPLMFLYNAFLIFTTSLVVYLFKHRILFHLDVPKRLEISGKDALLAEYSADCCWCGSFCVDK